MNHNLKINTETVFHGSLVHVEKLLIVDKDDRQYSDSAVVIIPIPFAAQSKGWDCGRSLAGTAGSNPAGNMDVCLL